MSEEETADKPLKAKRARARRALEARDPRAAQEPSPSVDIGVLIQRMAGKPAGDVLSRISNGDPLRLYPLCAARIRDTYYVLDPDRVFERVLALVAVGIAVEVECCQRPDWLLGMIDRAIRLTLDQDREEERAGLPPENPEENFRLFVEAFFIEPSLARLSAVRLNGLGERVRKGFYHLLIEGRPLEECLGMGLGPPERLHHDILTALQAVGLIDEKGFEELKGKEAEP